MMESFQFDPRRASSEGLVAIGGRLNVKTVLAAYQAGCFPWPSPGLPLLWFSPNPRGVLFFRDLHVGKSLKKYLRKVTWQFTVNRAFERVIRLCSQVPRKGQTGPSWITPEMIDCYCDLHRLGYGQSIEVWDEREELVGGIYGLLLPRYFSAESMFHLRSNASKVALIYLTHWLQETHGLSWMDIQMLTPVTQSLGGRGIEREEFLRIIGYSPNSLL